MSNIHTLTEHAVRVVKKETYDNDVEKLAKICTDLNQKYLAEMRKNVKNEKMVKLLAQKLRAATDELNKLKNQPVVVSGGKESFLSKLNKKLYEVNGLSKEEIENLEKEASEAVKSLGF